MANKILISNLSVGSVVTDYRDPFNQTESGLMATASFRVDLSQFSNVPVSGTISLALDGFWGRWGTQDIMVAGPSVSVNGGSYGQPTTLTLTSQFGSFPTEIYVNIRGIDPNQIDRLTVSLDTATTSLQSTTDFTSVLFEPGPPVSVDGLNQTDVVDQSDLLISSPYQPIPGTNQLYGTADGYGVDTLDLSALGGSVQLYADVGTIVWTPDGKNSPENSKDFGDSVNGVPYGRYVIHSTQDGSVIYGSKYNSETFVVSGNGVKLTAGSFVADGLTDVVDYSRLGTYGVSVDLGSQVNGFTIVNRGSGGDVKDYIKGVEGVVGSQFNDTIKGDLKDNLLLGGHGDDQLDGGLGDDILVGGNGSGDVLKGGAGDDVLIDLDGGVLRGNAELNTTGGEGRDVYIVRAGPTAIQNFHLSGPNTHLAGQQSKVNDVIAFNLALGTYAGLDSFLDNVTELRGVTTDYDIAVARWLSKNVDVEFEQVGATADFDVVLSLDVINEYYDVDSLQMVTATFEGELARVRLTDIGDLLGSGRELGAVDIFSVAQYYDPFPTSFDGEVLKNMLYPVFSEGVAGSGAGEFYLAIQSSRIGTVTTPNQHGVSAGDFNLAQRFFNPGQGNERLIGGFTKDDYEFILQDFASAPPGPGGTGQGNDRVFDVGGTDRIFFSDLTIDEILVGDTGDMLNLHGSSVGREREHNSLTVEYTQSNWNPDMLPGESTLVNSGTVDFVGHFREGGATALEEIVLVTDVYKIAETRYDVDQGSGDLIDDSPVEFVALSGVNSFMVGRYDQDDPRAPHGEKFVVKASENSSGSDETNLYLWNFDEADDLIVLEGFTNTSTNGVLDVNGIRDSVSFTSDQGVVNITFMDTNLIGGLAIEELAWMQAV